MLCASTIAIGRGHRHGLCAAVERPVEPGFAERLRLPSEVSAELQRVDSFHHPAATLTLPRTPGRNSEASRNISALCVSRADTTRRW